MYNKGLVLIKEPTKIKMCYFIKSIIISTFLLCLLKKLHLLFLVFTVSLSCMRYTTLVNIIHLRGSCDVPEPLSPKESETSLFYPLCRFLYIVELASFYRFSDTKRVHKNWGVYALFFFSDIQFSDEFEVLILSTIPIMIIANNPIT
jgi:hypothetical protein